VLWACYIWWTKSGGSGGSVADVIEAHDHQGRALLMRLRRPRLDPAQCFTTLLHMGSLPGLFLLAPPAKMSPPLTLWR